MICIDELKEKTGYTSFLKFRKKCYSAAIAFRNPKLTTYYYDKSKEIDRDIEPQELFTAAEQEMQQRKQSV